jgi:hypothetical protein
MAEFQATNWRSDFIALARLYERPPIGDAQQRSAEIYEPQNVGAQLRENALVVAASLRRVDFSTVWIFVLIFGFGSFPHKMRVCHPRPKTI